MGKHGLIASSIIISLFIYSASTLATQPEDLIQAQKVLSTTDVTSCEHVLDGLPEDLTKLDSSYHVVLDTNTIMKDPNCIFSFGSARVIIPVVTFQELNYNKDNYDDPIAGMNVRRFFATIKRLSIASKGAREIPLKKTGGLLIIDRDSKSPDYGREWKSENNDTQILEVAHALNKKHNGKVLFVTSDSPAFIQALQSGIPAVEYSSPLTRTYTGRAEYVATKDQRLEFVKSGKLILPDNVEFTANQYVTVNDEPDKPIDEMDFSNIGRLRVTRDENGVATEKYLTPLLNFKKMNFLLSPRNREQAMALDLLLNPDIHLVTMSGLAGTGKTLLSIAAALYQTMPRWNGSDPAYDEMMVSRHIITLGKEIGALPGDGEEKVSPYLQPYFDNIEQLVNIVKDNGWKPSKPMEKDYSTTSDVETIQVLNTPYVKSPTVLIPDDYERLSSRAKKNWAKKYQRQHGVDPREAITKYLETKNKEKQVHANTARGIFTADQIWGDEKHVSIEVLSFIRGRSLVKKIFIIDEAQNLNSHEIQSIVTRAGKGTKIILIGDVGQIDTRQNHINNGLSIAINLFRDQDITGHISLVKGERSPLADLANRLYGKLNGMTEE